MEQPPSPAHQALGLADLALAALALAAAFVLSLAPVSDPDLFWHLAVGRYTAEHGAPPTRNLWSFTAPDHPFAATSWLFGWAAHQLERAGGLAAVQLAAATAIGLAFALVYLTARRLGANRTLALSLTLAATAAAQLRFTQRPHALSYLFLAAICLLLAHARRTRRAWPLLAIPPLIAVWSNLHSGAVFGVGAVGCLALAELADRALGRGGTGEPPPRRWLAATCACAAVAVAALAANPSGIETLGYVFFHLNEVDQVVKLGEFLVPPLETFGAYWGLLGVVALALAWRGRRVDGFELLVTLAFAALSVRAVRVAPKFLIVAIPYAAASLQEALARLGARWSHERWSRRWAGRLAAVSLPPAALVLGLLPSPEPLAHFVRRIQLGPNPYRVPEEAAAFARAHGLRGRCFTSWDLSGYVEWALPDSTVYLDPRLLAYPPEVFSALAEAERTQEGFDALMDRHGVEWVFRSYRSLRLSGVGRFQPERWALVYRDEAGAIYVRRGVERLAPLARELEIRELLPGRDLIEQWRRPPSPERARWVTEVVATARQSPRFVVPHGALCFELAGAGDLAGAAKACAWAKAAVEERARFFPLEGNHRREVASGLLHLGGRLLKARSPAAARAVFEQALEMAPGQAQALANLGWSWLEERPEEARRYFERALESDPSSPAARRGLQQALQALGQAGP